MNEIEAYVRKAAAVRGIDPDIAVRVVRSEGGFSDPVKQSDVKRNGIRETSYGPFQLRIGGGLGDAALRAGIDPRKESDWKRGVDFALDYAAQNGWGEWMGAGKIGITGKEGVTPGVTLNSGPGLGGRLMEAVGFPPSFVEGAPNVVAGVESLADPYIPDTMKTPGSIAPLIGAGPVAPAAPAAGAPAASPFNPFAGRGFDSLLSKLGSGLTGGGGGGDSASTTITPSSIGNEVGAGSGAYSAAANLLMQLLADKRKRYGMSLNGMNS